MTDDQQRARELKPCPFCGNAMAEEEDGAYQNDGFVGPQTPVWLVRCPNSDCNASVSRTSKESAIAAWNRRAALRAAPKWQPIETAPEGRLVVVGWLDTEDSHYPENYEFDYLEGGLWAKHED
ncbi:Lar family restriction alleviation protein, partial [Stenotrophomonas sp. UBA7606]|uniref:Lar family restriction alleviation protein n=1 Tax=Stenotrophomonas sp. UBA7606 TaxID=1947559 RepID=UPI0025D3FDBB